MRTMAATTVVEREGDESLHYNIIMRHLLVQIKFM